jgi:hypothetical protein
MHGSDWALIYHRTRLDSMRAFAPNSHLLVHATYVSPYMPGHMQTIGGGSNKLDDKI